MKKKSSIKIYKDGAVVRFHNKRILIGSNMENVFLRFSFLDLEADKPACGHVSHKGKIRETSIKMSVEAMEALICGYNEYRKQTIKNKTI